MSSLHARPIPTAFTIPNGASVSNAVEMPPMSWLGLKCPDAWTAATIALEFSEHPTSVADADFWVWARDTADIALPAAANRYITTPHGLMLPFYGTRTRLRLRSGTRAVPVNQAAERVITGFIARLN